MSKKTHSPELSAQGSLDFAAAALIASHKASAARAAAWLKAHGNYTLRPTDGLELVAHVLGVGNWQTLHGMAKRGQSPRAAQSQDTRQPAESDQELFERCFATGHAQTDKRNFSRHGAQYSEDRICALYQGFTRGLMQGRQNSIDASKGAQSHPSTDTSIQLPQVGTPASSSPLSHQRGAWVEHDFAPGGAVSVENTREEMRYRGTVLKVDGSKVTVQLPAASNRPFIFDLADPAVSCEGNVLFTVW